MIVKPNMNKIMLQIAGLINFSLKDAYTQEIAINTYNPYESSLAKQIRAEADIIKQSFCIARIYYILKKIFIYYLLNVSEQAMQ